jgi:hypothetical protein
MPAQNALFPAPVTIPTRLEGMSVLWRLLYTQAFLAPMKASVNVKNASYKSGSSSNHLNNSLNCQETLTGNEFICFARLNVTRSTCGAGYVIKTCSTGGGGLLKD